ncbi:MAG: DNA polymerase III subunit delta [Actinomycetaceae bacterium]|nr:DNA polymerase III subunit delta [Actinomycetaceae bacterium]
MATTRKKTTRAKRPANEKPWQQAALAPVVMIRAEEDVLGDLAVAQLRNQARASAPVVEMHSLTSSEYQGGHLAAITSPSLFGEPRFVVVNQMENAGEELAQDLINYLPDPDPDSVVVLRFNANSRRVKMMEAIKKAKVPVYFAAQLRYPSEKANFVRSVVRQARREMEEPAISALVDALPDAAELFAMTNQLLADVNGTVTAQDVHKYQAGRVESDVFSIINQAVAGNRKEALRLLRHGLATGIRPVQLHGAIAARVRLIAKVSGPNPPGYTELRVAPRAWQEAKQAARRYRPKQLAQLVESVARTEADLKGQSKAPNYALEKLIIELSN